MIKGANAMDIKAISSIFFKIHHAVKINERYLEQIGSFFLGTRSKIMLIRAMYYIRFLSAFGLFAKYGFIVS